MYITCFLTIFLRQLRLTLPTKFKCDCLIKVKGTSLKVGTIAVNKEAG